MKYIAIDHAVYCGKRDATMADIDALVDALVEFCEEQGWTTGGTMRLVDDEEEVVDT